MSEKYKKIHAVLTLMGGKAAYVSMARERPAKRAVREAAESYARRAEAAREAYQREKNREIAQERYGDLWQRDDRPRSTAPADPTFSGTSMWRGSMNSVPAGC